MIIDDNFIDQKIHTKIISHSQRIEEIINCYSVDDALQYLKHSITNHTKAPDIILLDIQMPEKNGFDFLKEFKILHKKYAITTKIYILSSSLDTSDILKANKNPFVVDFFIKPLNLSIFKEKFQDYINAIKT